jgi:predicted small lipoprotein YifL
MICWARYLLLAVVAVLAGGQIIAACGQKGDLYLPEKDKATEQPRPATERQAPAAATQPLEPDPGGEALEAEDDVPDVTPSPVSPSGEGL